MVCMEMQGRLTIRTNGKKKKELKAKIREALEDPRFTSNKDLALVFEWGVLEVDLLQGIGSLPSNEMEEAILAIVTDAYSPAALRKALDRFGITTTIEERDGWTLIKATSTTVKGIFRISKDGRLEYKLSSKDPRRPACILIQDILRELGYTGMDVSKQITTTRSLRPHTHQHTPKEEGHDGF